MKRIFSIAILISAMWALPALGAAGGPVKLSLADALKMAQEQNPMLAAARGDAAAADARVGMANAARQPVVSATSFLTDGDMNTVLAGPDSIMPRAYNATLPKRYFDQNLMLMYPLDVSGRLSSVTRGAARRSEAAGHDAEALRQRTLFAVRAAYYDALYRESAVAVYGDSAAVYEAQLKNDRAALDAGKIPAFYIDRDEAMVAEAQQMNSESRRMAAAAKIRLAALLGLDPDTKLELSDRMESFKAGDLSLIDPLDAALAPPEIKAARARAEAAEAGLRSAQKASSPDVSLAVMGDYTKPQMGDAMKGAQVALVVAVPIVDGGMRKSSRKEAEAMKEAAAQDLRSAQLELAADYSMAKLDFKTAREKEQSAVKGLKAATSAYEVAKLRFDNGKGIQVELMDAAAALTRARVAVLEAMRDELTAYDNLLRIGGKL